MLSPSARCMMTVLALLSQGLPSSIAVAADIPQFGRAPTDAEIAAWNINVEPNGAGLPIGHGSVERGKAVFAENCAVCHGATGVEGPKDRLVGGLGTLNSAQPIKTVGSY